MIQDFLVLGREVGLFHSDLLRWERLTRGTRLQCLVAWALPLLRDSYRLKEYEALWSAWPYPQGKGKGKGMMFVPTDYQDSLRALDKERVVVVIREETRRHILTRHG